MKPLIQRSITCAVMAMVLVLFSSMGLLAQEKASYKVKKGDTLYGISKSLDVTIAELKQWNNISGSEIELGQELVYYLVKDSTETDLPETDSSPLLSQASSSQNVYYTVKSGDTLYQIARDHDMTVDQIKSLNNLSSDNLRIGQQLAVKKRNEAPPSVSEFNEESTPQGIFTVYEVKSGETVTRLLSKFKMTEDEFRTLNPELNLDKLAIGQEVTILLPPSRSYKNPFLQKANLEDLGEVRAFSYQNEESGEATTNGELYDPEALTGAHSNIAMGSIIFVENIQTKEGVYIRINDRITNSGLKLSQKAFTVLGLDRSAEPTVTIFTESND